MWFALLPLIVMFLMGCGDLLCERVTGRPSKPHVSGLSHDPSPFGGSGRVSKAASQTVDHEQ